MKAEYLRMAGAGREFVERIARLTKDRECIFCREDGDEPNVNCVPGAHLAYDLESDDAVETLHSLITIAREIVGRPK